MIYHYDVIVIGGGHAGCEAALAAARYGAKTLLLTINLDHIAQMSCNPAIGGIAKGQLVREIDALGGAQGVIADAAGIQFRMLNSTKGPAVWSPRAQCDKVCYQRAMKMLLENQDNLDIKQASVHEFILEKGRVAGVKSCFEDMFYASATVVAAGTFLAGILHYGMMHFPGGRAGDPPADELSWALREQLGLRSARLKTGTPPRILSKSIDFSQMKEQHSEVFEEKFSHFPVDDLDLPRAERREMSCFMVYSNDETAALVRANLDKSPMYQGKIKAIGTRYCPSFEDKVVRFPQHEQHLLYLEPEGEYTGEYYVNGISTSLPPEVQTAMIRSVPGLENAQLSRYAYAIEYDFLFPDQLERSLRVKRYGDLFLAGQINGTSGYEEAAGQGLLAGLNAARHAAGKDALEMPRDSSYIGVMIDDLVTKEIIEPYRLFTSRAEYRLHLRQDNADLRLCRFAYENGLLSEDKFQSFAAYEKLCNDFEKLCRERKSGGRRLWDSLKELKGIFKADTPLPFNTGELFAEFDRDDVRHRRAMRQIVIKSHYEGYLEREQVSIQRLRKLEAWRIPVGFDYDAISGLRNESRFKLKEKMPTTLAQAGRIDGVTPAEIALLQVHLKRREAQ